ncbi:Crp/Fnr family transcriptional regulator [Sphingomonas sp.]|uniref:Crp/Fnr family transcriptional regulator n=1 Tax=Sphingomonas sp. TaxID=28214 RepID=UPI002DD63DA6|nr:Crp/Fnr family transcriptional regulator [Sphingomonas sp.]
MSQQLIRKLEVVERLSESEREMVRALCADVRTIARRRDIISEGDDPDFVHVVIDGWAARYKVLEDGARSITAFFMPGDFCDLHVTILDAMDHGILALTDCKVGYIANQDIDQVTRVSATLARAFWRSTLVDEAILREWVVSAARRTAVHSLGHLFCELHLRAKLVGLADDGRLDLPLTQEDLADATGLTPVHVNRMLQELRKQGLIEIGRRELVVLDVPALQQFSGFDPTYLHVKLSHDYPDDRPRHAPSMT